MSGVVPIATFPPNVMPWPTCTVPVPWTISDAKVLTLPQSDWHQKVVLGAPGARTMFVAVKTFGL